MDMPEVVESRMLKVHQSLLPAAKRCSTTKSITPSTSPGSSKTIPPPQKKPVTTNITPTSGNNSNNNGISTNLRYFTNLLKQRKFCEICASSSKVISMRSWDKRNSSFTAAILFSNIRNFANYSDDCL